MTSTQACTHTHTYTHADSHMQTDTHNYTHDFNMFTVYDLSYKIHIFCSTCLKCHFLFFQLCPAWLFLPCKCTFPFLKHQSTPPPPTPQTHTHTHTHTQDTPLAHKEDAGVVYSQQRILFVKKMGGKKKNKHSYKDIFTNSNFGPVKDFMRITILVTNIFCCSFSILSTLKRTKDDEVFILYTCWVVLLPRLFPLNHTYCTGRNSVD